MPRSVVFDTNILGPEDNAVLECALEGKAEFIVGGDGDLLGLKNFRGIEILRARQFLDVLAARPD